jgi:hypothetical protein
MLQSDSQVPTGEGSTRNSRFPKKCSAVSHEQQSLPLHFGIEGAAALADFLAVRGTMSTGIPYCPPKRSLLAEELDHWTCRG